ARRDHLDSRQVSVDIVTMISKTSSIAVAVFSSRGRRGEGAGILDDMTGHDQPLIRDARPDERDAVQSVTLAAYEEYAATMPEPLWTGYRQHLLATLDTEGPVERIVAERVGAIVGSVLLFPPSTKAYGTAAVSVDCPEVRLLAVPRRARGQGAGAALMEECSRRAR